MATTVRDALDDSLRRLFLNRPLWLGLGTRADEDAVEEVWYPGYLRRSLELSDPEDVGGGRLGRQVYNLDDIAFPVDRDVSIIVRFVLIYDAPTGGNLVWAFPLAKPARIAPGMYPVWTRGALSIAIEPQ